MSGTADRTRSRISLAPTGHGLAYLAFTAALLVVAVIYNNNPCFVLAFAALSVTAVSVPVTLAKARRLRVTAVRCDPVHAGSKAQYRLALRLEAGRAADVGLALGGGHTVRETAPGAATVFRIAVPAPRRGLLEPGPARIMTEHPLGLFRAWFTVPAPPCLIWPRPLPGPESVRPDDETGPAPRSAAPDVPDPGGEDFRDLAAFRHGDPPSRVAWKASVRGQGLRTKVFETPAARSPVFDWHALGGPGEERLSRLCHMVLEASRSGRAFGLRLPGTDLAVDAGEGHRRRALGLLAVHGLDDSPGPRTHESGDGHA